MFFVVVFFVSCLLFVVVVHGYCTQRCPAVVSRNGYDSVFSEPSQISVTFNGDLLSVKLFKYKLQMLQDGWFNASKQCHQDFNIPDAIYISRNTGSTVAVKLLMTTERL